MEPKEPPSASVAVTWREDKLVHKSYQREKGLNLFKITLKLQKPEGNYFVSNFPLLKFVLVSPLIIVRAISVELYLSQPYS